MRSARVLGIRVDCAEMEDALAVIERMVAAGGPPRLVATVNPEFVMHARRDAAFRDVLERAALCVPDGHYVVWAMRRQGCTQRDRVTGIDLVPRLAELCAARGHRLFLLGASPGVAAEAASVLQDRFPGLQIAGAEPGSPRAGNDSATVELVNRASPDILLVAYGHPAQELWIDRNRSRLGVPVAIGVGGAFDFIAGRVRRAPAWLQRAHLEWLWRLLLQPWRARRMAVLPAYALRVLADRHG
jgi:N-acetylglucosaminyldiphosphoundecaprenol N-acetyl-beta-D-mannosaminyltransferase